MTSTLSLLPDGVWPTMITPFHDDENKSIDWEGLDILTEWYIQSGVAGIFSICLSSEMFQLNNDERLRIVQRVVDKVAGRVPVVAGGTFEGSLEDQATLMNAMGKMVTAVVIITNQIARMDESDDIWLANAQKLLDLTGDIPIGIYETPVPKVRSLTPAMMTWVAKSDRFVFHKDTSLNIELMIEKIKAVQAIPNTKLKFYTAKIQFLKAALDNGANGFSGVTTNFHPWMVVWMCKSMREPEEKREKMHQFLSVTDRVLAHKYPVSAKGYLNKFYNVPIKPVSRMMDVVLNDQDLISLQCMKSLMEQTALELDVAIVDPLNCVENNFL